MRLARPLSLALLLAALLAVGCGSDSNGDGDSSGGGGSASETSEEGEDRVPAGATATSCEAEIDGIDGSLRVTGVDCDAAGEIASGWVADRGCASPSDASRVSCKVDGYRCLGARIGPGIAVSCARPERSIAFVAKRGG